MKKNYITVKLLNLIEKWKIYWYLRHANTVKNYWNRVLTRDSPVTCATSTSTPPALKGAQCREAWLETYFSRTLARSVPLQGASNSSDKTFPGKSHSNVNPLCIQACVGFKPWCWPCTICRSSRGAWPGMDFSTGATIWWVSLTETGVYYSQPIIKRGRKSGWEPWQGDSPTIAGTCLCLVVKLLLINQLGGR